MWCSRRAALEIVDAAFMDDDEAKRPFHQAELAASFLVQISRCVDSSRHGEQILSSDSLHGNGPGDRWCSHVFAIEILDAHLRMRLL